MNLRLDLEKEKYQEDKFKMSSIVLDQIISNQKNSKEKGGLGFEKGEISKVDQTPSVEKKNNEQKNIEDKKSNGKQVWNQRKDFKRPPTQMHKGTYL